MAETFLILDVFFFLCSLSMLAPHPMMFSHVRFESTWSYSGGSKAFQDRPKTQIVSQKHFRQSSDSFLFRRLKWRTQNISRSGFSLASPSEFGFVRSSEECATRWCRRLDVLEKFLLNCTRSSGSNEESELGDHSEVIAWLHFGATDKVGPFKKMTHVKKSLSVVLCQDLSLSPHVDKLSMTLSGGNKRHSTVFPRASS